jgi:hypothetical protein
MTNSASREMPSPVAAPSAGLSTPRWPWGDKNSTSHCQPPIEQTTREQQLRRYLSLAFQELLLERANLVVERLDSGLVLDRGLAQLLHLLLPFGQLLTQLLQLVGSGPLVSAIYQPRLRYAFFSTAFPASTSLLLSSAARSWSLIRSSSSSLTLKNANHINRQPEIKPRIYNS